MDHPPAASADRASQEPTPEGRASVRRHDYSGDGLVESDVAASPYLQARAWLDAALSAADERDDVPEPTALSVATVDPTGTPDVRTVLMRFFDERGPGFVTNLGSAKSQQLQANPRAAASLTWPAIYRAIRFRGTAGPVARDEVEAYFATRPYGARLSAWASDQSRPAADRAELERKWQEALERFPDTGSDDDVPAPDFWGGWRIVCDEVEFWAGRSNRLHDRILFRRTGPGDLADAGAWTRLRLQP